MWHGRSGKFLALGTTGLAAAVTLMMVLAPAAAGGITHPTILKPTYKGTSTPNSFVSLYGCAGAKASAPKWNAKTGNVSISNVVAAKTCPASLAGVGGTSSAFSTYGMTMAIPFVVTTGSHSIAESWTVKIASAHTNTVGGCPSPTWSYPPALNSYDLSYCESASGVSFNANAAIVDLNNNSWYSNYSYAAAYDNGFWENFTYCYNYGTPACANTTGSFPSTYSYWGNTVGFSAWAWNGVTTFTMYTNGTNMVRGHVYVLIVTISDDKNAYVTAYNEKGHWTASAAAAVNMAPPSNGAKLNSITIV
jgi:hypothetical protein